MCCQTALYAGIDGVEVTESHSVAFRKNVDHGRQIGVQRKPVQCHALVHCFHLASA